MKRITFILLLTILAVVGVSAQRPGRGAISEQDREKWLNEMRNLKHDFFVKELQLTKEQQDAFFPIYDAMDDEINQVTLQTRELENKVSSDTEASDIEIEAAARALFEQKSREGAIEINYFEKFKDTLTPTQLLRLKNTERKFTQQLVKQHGRAKSEQQRRKQ